jgi:hypothetical protein
LLKKLIVHDVVVVDVDVDVDLVVNHEKARKHESTWARIYRWQDSSSAVSQPTPPRSAIHSRLSPPFCFDAKSRRMPWAG